MPLKYLHTMVRVKDLEKSMAFYELLGLKQTRRYDNEGGRFSLIFLAPPGQEECPVELTYNWDGDDELPSDSRHFGHLAYEVDNIYETCQFLMDNGVTINRRRAMGAWPLCARLTISRSNCCKPVTRLRRQSLGPAWKTPATGKANRRRTTAFDPRECFRSRGFSFLSCQTRPAHAKQPGAGCPVPG